MASEEQEREKREKIQYIYHRPEMYLGARFKQTESVWVWDGEKQKMFQRSMTYIPAILKMFDEVIVNAADNKVRDPTMSKLDVSIDLESYKVTVFNDGDGVPVEKNDRGIYLPETMFSYLPTTSSNNSETESSKLTGGINGLGAKLTNIFSTQFEIEIVDEKKEKVYKQLFTNNMLEKGGPVETQSSGARSSTKVSFVPDMAYFNMDPTTGDDDVVELIKTRVHQIAWFLGTDVEVTLQGQIIQVGPFGDYVSKYFVDDSNPRVFAEKLGGSQWDVCLSLSEGQFQQVSFVNSVATIRGGAHVDYVTDVIAQHVVEHANKKQTKKGIGNKLEINDVKIHLRVFVNARIDNPMFESQKKELLVLPRQKLPTFVATDILLKKDKASRDLVKKLVLLASTHSNEVARTEVETWEDAYNALTKKSDKCTLVIIEGKSAKSLAMAGLSSLSKAQRNGYGIFPLMGKIPNVRSFNEEHKKKCKLINDLNTLIGLGAGMKRRYERILIMTDQDEDGIHIKGLVINLFHTLWPSLLEQENPPFINDFITPAITATPLDGDRSKTEFFYSCDDYKIWEENEKQGNDKLTGWTIQRYKGLGAFTSEDGKYIFSRLSKQERGFHLGKEKDEDYQANVDAFSTATQPRKDSMIKSVRGLSYDGWTASKIRYKEFFEKEYIKFSLAHLQRSIPSSADGLTPVQRKLIYSFLKRKLTRMVKLSQLYGFVAEDSDYHHSEQSLAATIVKMANDYVGSNNINMLEPLGQFGTRAGDGSANPRYLDTKLSPVTRDFLFPEKYDDLLFAPTDQNRNEGPTRLYPIIPIVLVNGCCGVASGCRSFIPNYHPLDIVANLKRMIKGEKTVAMIPWYRGFEGKIHDSDKGKHKTVGKFSLDEEKNILTVTELPIGRSRNSYKKFLNRIGRGSHPLIKGYQDNSDDRNVDYEIALSEGINKKAKQEGWIEKNLKLITYLDTKSMHLFDNESGQVKHFKTAHAIIEEFYHLMMLIFGEREESILDNVKHEQEVASSKLRFVSDVVNGDITLQSGGLLKYFEDEGFPEYQTTNVTDGESEKYGYLLDISARWFCETKLKELQARRKDTDEENEQSISAGW